VRPEFVPPDRLLHLRRQIRHQRQPAAHPALAPVESFRQRLFPQIESLPQLVQQPPLLQRVRSLFFDISAKSGASRSPIPVEADHQFRSKPITDSG
jgi:hypothetical protein